MCEWKRILALAAWVLVAVPSVHADDIDIFAYRAGQGTPTGASSNILILLENGASFGANNNAFRCGIDGSGTSGVVYTSESEWTSSGSGRRASNFPGTPLDKTNGGVEQCALYAALKALATQLDASNVTLNLAIMVFNRAGQAHKTFDVANNAFFSTNKCVAGAGGCLVLPMTPFTNPTNRGRILDWIKNWSRTGNYDISGPANLGNGAAFQEAWAYLNGVTGLSTVNYATAFPARPTSCGRDNIIYIGNNYDTQATPKDGNATADNPRNPLIGSAPSAAMNVPGASSSSTYAVQLPAETIPLKCTSSSSLVSQVLDTSLGAGGYALNWAKYLYDNTNALTVAVGVQGPTCDTKYAAHLEKLGDVGGGGVYTGSNYTEIQTAISQSFNKVLAVNSAYAAVSLPASTAAQGQFLNQVFVGLFRPSSSFEPRWAGNLKQYQFGLNAGTLQLVDANGRAAVSSETGFIDSCARSFWTPTVIDNYWGGGLGAGECGTGQYSGDVTATAAQMQLSNVPDGPVVEKGGHGYWLRGGSSWGTTSLPGSRNVYTCAAGSSCTTLTSFATSNTAITQASLDSTAGATNRSTLINWLRGENSKSAEEAQALANAPVRSSVHGAVIHSRPVAVNFEADETATPKVVVFYGANDGLLRAVNGAQSSPTTFGSTSYPAGSELWSFMPPEFYPSIKRLYDNTPNIAYPGAPAGSLPKSYGMDGPITSWRGSIGGSNVVYLYAPMRRGGRVLYAFDVTSPQSPSLMWRRGCPNNFALTLDSTSKMSGSSANDTGCTNDATAGDFRGLGQSWSSMKPIKLPGRNPALLVSGGYDPCEDIDNGTSNHGCTSASKGRKMFVLDAQTGNVLRAFDTARSVVAEPTIATDSNGNALYAYVADLGGEVYRICFVSGCSATSPATTSINDWTITRIASLGCDSPSTSTYTPASTGVTGGGYAWPTYPAGCNAPRKFLFPPSVITPDSGVSYYVTLVSGDREKPVAAYVASQAVKNVAIQVRDQPASATWLNNACSVGGATTSVICMGSPTGSTSGSTTTATAGSSLTRIDPTTISAPSTVSAKGWFLPLDSTEQGVTGALTIFGTVTFSTNKPPSGGGSTSCGPSLGETRVYNVNYLNATPVKTNATSRWERLTGDGLPPSLGTGGRVTITSGSTTTTVPYCIGCSATSPLAGGAPFEASSVTQPKQRLYRYIVK